MANGGSLSEAPKGTLSNKILLVLLFLMLAINLYQQMHSMELYTTNNTFQTINNEWEPLWGKEDNEDSEEEEQEDDEATTILRRSYEQSYAHILPCDDDNPSWIDGDGTSKSTKACMQKTLDYFLNNPNNETIPSIPWWFQTLLRDIQRNGAFGYWHHFYTTEPALNFCTIGKVATTEWRKVFCKLNAEDCVANPEACGKRNCAWRTLKEMPEGASPWAVFLRDPLERLLSGKYDVLLYTYCSPTCINMLNSNAFHQGFWTNATNPMYADWRNTARLILSSISPPDWRMQREKSIHRYWTTWRGTISKCLLPM